MNFILITSSDLPVYPGMIAGVELKPKTCDAIMILAERDQRCDAFDSLFV